MTIKTPDGKWKWGNVERPSKKELVQTVYGIWKKNGSKGSFSKFLHGKHVDENTVKGKDGHWILFCDECDMNMTKAPDDQYLMIDDKLWEWVCNHGGKKLDPDEAVICRNCIEKRLGRPLTLKDLGDKKNLPANDAFKNMLKYGNRDIVSELCKAVAKHKVRDEDGDMVSVAFGGNCGIFAYTLLMFLNDVDYNFYEWRFGLFFDGIRSLSQIYNDNNDADLNHVVAIIDDVAYDGSGKTNLNKWYGKLFQIDDAEEVADIIDQFTVFSIGVNALYKIFEKEWKNLTKKRKMNEAYERPYTLDTIKQKYGVEAYRRLRDDPVHRFRAETGIEVIHKEPTRDEFERIVKNWDLMTPEQKKQSDEFSIKQFGRDNKDRIELLRKEYDFKVGDRVTIKKGLRCRQSGHSGEIIRVNLPEDHDYDSHGFSSFTIKMDDPSLGITSFQSGAIEKEMKKESLNEAHEIHSYPETLQPIIDRIVKGNEDYELDHAYFNKEGKFIWMRNLRGYFHVFKPVKFVKTPGMTKPFGFKDLILKDNGMLEEIDRLRFVDGNEGLSYLSKRYNLDVKKIK